MLTPETLDFFRTVRPELFQFEIGVQSTNPQTLKAIRRQNDWPALCSIVQKIKSYHNIHQHLDLIAGLPYENYDSFHRSFNDVYALEPEQLQLGFLKILKGSGLSHDQQKYGLISRDYPPFEVLFTPDLPYSDTLRLKAVEEMVEQYYNSGRFVHALHWLFSQLEDPFLFYQSLGDLFVAEGHAYESQSLEQRYAFFHRFCVQLPEIDSSAFTQYLKLDYCLHQRPKRHPDWFTDGRRRFSPARAAIFGAGRKPPQSPAGFSGNRPQMLYKLVHIEPFSINVLTGAAEPIVLLFDYRRRDLLGNAYVQLAVLPE